MAFNVSTDRNTTMKILGIILGTIAVVLIVLFLVKGQTIVSGNFPEDEVDESMLCTRQNSGYFVFNDTRIIGDNTKLTLIFNNSKLRTASLTYSATTENEIVAQNIEAVMTAELNTSYGTEFGYNGLGANITSNDNIARLTIMATPSEMKENGKKYFLIDNISDNKDEYYNALTERGFNCQVINQ